MSATGQSPQPTAAALALPAAGGPELIFSRGQPRPAGTASAISAGLSDDAVLGLRRLLTRISEVLDEIVEATVTRVWMQAPELARLDSDETGATQHASARTNFEAILALMVSGVPEGRLEPPAITQERVRRMVELGIDLEPMMHSYRLGHAELWARWQREACRLGVDDEDLAALLDHSSGVMFTYMDRVCTAISEDYARRQGEWLRRAAAVRAEVVAQLLSGGERNAEHASRRLGYELARRHIAFIVWQQDTDEPFSTARLERAAISIAQRVGVGRPLMINAGASVLWAWCNAADLPKPELGHVLLSEQGDAVLRVALGCPHDGIEGFVLTHTEALATREHMCRPGSRSVATHYADIALASLLTADRPRAARYMRKVLGPLAADTDQMATLRSTLALLLAEGGSKLRTAKRVNLHPNTIAQRVAKIEELLGRSVEAGHQDLAAALTIAQTLPHELVVGARPSDAR